jgi:O-antigen/teichoic acid export membrane protein
MLRKTPSPLRRTFARILRADRPLFAMFQSFGTQALMLACNVLTGVIAARQLGPEGRGIYAAVTLWPPLLSSLAVAGIGGAVVFRMRKSPEAVGTTAGAALTLALCSGLVLIGVGLLVQPLFMRSYSASAVLLAHVCLLSVIANCIQQVMKQTFAGVGQYGLCNLTNLFPQLFHLIALLLIIPFTVLTATDATVALLVSSAIAVLCLIPWFVRGARPRLRGVLAELRTLSSFSYRAAPMDAVFALATYADRLVLIPFLPATEIGLYAVAFSFSRVIQIVQPAIMSVFLSHMAGQSGEKAKQLHDSACRFLLLLLLGGSAFLWVTGHALLGFAYGSQFSAANTVFRLLVVEVSLGVLSQATVQLFLASGRPGVVSIIQVVVLCASVAALLLLVPIYGAVGAALGLLLAGTLRWLLLLGAIPAVLGLPLPRLYLNREDFQYLRGKLRG